MKNYYVNVTDNCTPITVYNSIGCELAVITQCPESGNFTIPNVSLQQGGTPVLNIPSPQFVNIVGASIESVENTGCGTNVTIQSPFPVFLLNNQNGLIDIIVTDPNNFYNLPQIVLNHVDGQTFFQDVNPSTFINIHNGTINNVVQSGTGLNLDIFLEPCEDCFPLEIKNSENCVIKTITECPGCEGFPYEIFVRPNAQANGVRILGCEGQIIEELDLTEGVYTVCNGVDQEPVIAQTIGQVIITKLAGSCDIEEDIVIGDIQITDDSLAAYNIATGSDLTIDGARIIDINFDPNNCSYRIEVECEGEECFEFPVPILNNTDNQVGTITECPEDNVVYVNDINVISPNLSPVNIPAPTQINITGGNVDDILFNANNGQVTIDIDCPPTPPPSTGMFTFGLSTRVPCVPLQDVSPIFLSVLQPTKISIGVNHGLAIINGDLYGWGQENSLGIANSNNYTPISLLDSGGYTDIVAGDSFSLAIKNGTLRVTGANGNGQLGLGNTTNQFTWVQVGSDTDWSAVSCGLLWSQAIKGGNAFTCGSNANFRTGQNTSVGNTTSWTVITATGTVTFIECGANFGGYIDAGTLHTWGTNGNGRTGQGTAAGNTQVPTQVGSDTNWSKIALNVQYGHGIKTNGQLWGWGGNTQGQLGIGNVTQQNSPVQVGSDTDWLEVRTRITGNLAAAYTIAQKTNGTLWGAGSDGESQLNGVTGLDVNTSFLQITNFAVGTYDTELVTIYVRS